MNQFFINNRALWNENCPSLSRYGVSACDSLNAWFNVEINGDLYSKDIRKILDVNASYRGNSVRLLYLSEYTFSQASHLVTGQLYCMIYIFLLQSGTMNITRDCTYNAWFSSKSLQKKFMFKCPLCKAAHLRGLRLKGGRTLRRMKLVYYLLVV